MKVVVVRTLPHEGRMVPPGETLDLSPAEAQALITRGKVVDADQVRDPNEGGSRADRKRG
jgi:hypothetical protein